MPSRTAKLRTDSNKQSSLQVSHTTDASVSKTFSFGITNNGILAITTGSNISSEPNKIMQITANSSTSTSKPTIELKGNVVVNGNLVVVGQTTQVSIQSETVAIGDNMIQLNANLIKSNGYTPNVDFGFYGQTTVSGNINYAGIGYINSTDSITTFRTTTSPGQLIQNIQAVDLRSSGKLSVADKVILSSHLSVAKKVILSSDLSIANKVVLASDLSTSGEVVFGSHLSVAKRAVLSSDLSVGGKVIFGSHLSVAKQVILSSILSVGANTFITNSLSIGQTLYVAEDIISASDKKFKTNIETLQHSLEKIKKLRGVSFNWRNNEYPRFSSRKQIGLIAQEVREVYPELVKDGGNDSLSVSYDKIVAIIIESIKELDKKYEHLLEKNN